VSNFHKHAIQEFRAAGWLDSDGNFKDEMQEAICNNVLKMLDIFADEGHSGSSAPYAINLFSKIAGFEPIAPLTGADDEWFCHSDERTNGVSVYQNKRFSSVFKQSDRFDGQAYWLDGKVFWSWHSSPDIDDGEPFKSYFTSKDSMVPITFPWVKPESQYVFVPTEKFPNEVLGV
jgi:hypothetical protein